MLNHSLVQGNGVSAIRHRSLFHAEGPFQYLYLVGEFTEIGA